MPQQQQAEANQDKVPLKAWIAVIGAALGAFMAVLDIQIVNSSLQDIQGALGASLDEGTWIATSYLVAEIITIPLTPWLSRIFTPRWYVIGNACLFIIFSMCCACAWDLPSMILFRALQGFTGGTLIPMAFNIILTSLPKSKQPIGMALFSVTATFAPSIGPAIGGWLTDTFGWQYIFYLNILPGVLLVAILMWAMPKDKVNFSLLKDGDWFGIITMALGLGSLEIVLEEGNRKDWFGSTMIVQLSIIAVIACSLFLWRQLTAKKPLVNLSLLKRRNFGLGSIANVALGMALYGSVYLIPVYLASIQGYDAMQIGQVMMWMGLPQLVIIPFVPKLMKKIDPRLMLGFGLVLFGISGLMNAFMSADSSGPQMQMSLLVRALGQPLIMIPLSTLTTSGIEAAQAGSASALFNMMRNMGGSIGIALLSTFVTRREQLHSVRIGESIFQGSLALQDRINSLTAYFTSRGADLVSAHDQALQMLGNIVRRESFLMAYNDAFFLLGCTLFCVCFAVLLLKKPQGPASAEAH
jgi:DHA2 family multidrug resistance protein